MPCGGIYPMTGLENERCWYCSLVGSDHFVEEWDAGIHGACIEKFLKTPEGKIVLSHKHVVIREIEGTTEVLYKEGSDEPEQKGHTRDS